MGVTPERYAPAMDRRVALPKGSTDAPKVVDAAVAEACGSTMLVEAVRP
jgi:hypothetical protein